MPSRNRESSLPLHHRGLRTYPVPDGASPQHHSELFSERTQVIVTYVVIPSRIFNRLLKVKFYKCEGERECQEHNTTTWRPTPGQKRVKCSLHKISAKQNYRE